MNCVKLCCGVAFATVLTTSARAENVWEFGMKEGAEAAQTAGGIDLGNSWSNKLSNAMSYGVWVKNLTAPYFLYIGDIVNVFAFGANNNSQTVYFSTTQPDEIGGTNRTVKIECPQSTFRRWTWGAANKALDDDAWHFLMVTFSYDADDAAKRFQRMYVDGQLVAETAVAYGPLNKAPAKMHMTVGALMTDAGTFTYFNWCSRTGSFSEITLWDRALSSDEVSALCRRRVRGNEQGLVGYWPLNRSTLASFPNQVRGGLTSTAYASGGESGKYFRKVTQDDTLPLTSGRCVVSPEWVRTHGYVQSADATFRTWDDPATNIQEAADLNFEYETVRVMSGTYEIAQQIAVTNANQTVTSYDPDTGMSSRSNTVIDCGGRCRGFQIGKSVNNANIEVRGFTIVNGSAENGGGVQLNGMASSAANAALRCRLVDCTVSNCTASSCGGAVNIIGGYVTNSLLTHCTATTCGGAVCASRSAQNDARAHEYEFPAVYDCDFVGNYASRGGGYGNSTTYHWHSFLARNCRFRDNTAKDGGGHIDAAAGSWIEGCAFSGNCYAQYGSCLCSGSGNGGNCPATLTNCTFVGGTSKWGYGYLHPAHNTKIVDCIVTNNTYAPEFVFNEGNRNVIIRQCLFADNTQSAVVNGFNSQSTLIENCTVAMTGAMKSNGASSSHEIFRNCILGGTVTSSASHQAVVSNCTVKALGGTPHAANENVYVGRVPGFKDAAHGDYTLRPGAFARDKAEKLTWMNAGTKDLARQPRLVNRQGVANAADAGPDLGCFECQDPVRGMVIFVQ